jgi:exopolysaccharide biosynthesis WecB/TagA/CpsF family protein
MGSPILFASPAVGPRTIPPPHGRGKEFSLMVGIYIVNWILIVFSVLVLLPIAIFTIECLAAVVLQRKTSHGKSDSPNLEKPRTAVLIPAHNEQLVIEQTLDAVVPSQNARVLVIADNCDDQTAELASRCGAEVLVRIDPAHRGKGFALRHGLQALRQNPPDVVVVIDADCTADPQSVETLARQAWNEQRPVQALNLTNRDPVDGPIQAVSLLANRFGNQIRPLGLNALGLPCRLAGTGMAVPWQMLESVQPAGSSLVEDLQLGIDLTLHGHMTTFCPNASVVSSLPPNNRAFVSQRIRWDHGHLRMAAVQIPRLLAAAVRQRSWRLLGAALDLSIPPLTLLMSLWLVAVLLTGTAWCFGASWLPLTLLIGGGIALTIALGLGWAVFCRRCVPLRTFAAIPFYMLRKMPIYFQFLFRRQHDWVRTERVSSQSLPHDSFSVLGVSIRNSTRLKAIEQLENVLVHRNSRPASVFFVNAHTLNKAASDPSYRDVLNAADYVFADGTGVRWAAQLQNIRIRENMVGTDFVPALFEKTAGRGHTYFLLGADAKTIVLAADYARRKFSGWTQVGFHHGYLTDAATLAAAIEQINAARPDVLLVGMGNPLQERWIHRHHAQLDVGVCLGVGGLFDHWAGNINRAPRWLLKLGHEWLWLLWQQPRLKAGRYLIGNPLFLARILRERFGQSQRL